MPKVSIIIPIYKVEKYIERCARSLFEQTEEDLEFIFVNDGTPDNSMQILNDVIKDYPSRKNQIKIIENEKNLGLPLTRQRGLKDATGEYIIHCDSDDWVDRDMYRVLYEKAKSEDLDIVWCDYYRTDGVTNTYMNRKTNTDKITILKDALNEKITLFVWLYLVRRSVITSHNYITPCANFFEDMVLIIQYTYYSNKFGYINAPLYYYFINNNSISLSDSIEQEKSRLADAESNLKIVFSFLKQRNLDIVLKDEIYHRKFAYQMWSLCNVKKTKDCSKWINRYEKINRKSFFDYKIKLKNKLIYLLIGLRIYPILKRIQR